MIPSWPDTRIRWVDGCRSTSVKFAGTLQQWLSRRANPTKNYNAALSCIAAGVGQPTRRSLRCQSNALPRKRKKLHRNHCTCQCLALASKLWLLYKIKRRRAFVPDSILLTRCGLLACTHPLFLLEHEQWRCARRCVVHAPCCWTAMALLQHFRQVDGCFKCPTVNTSYHPEHELPP